MIAALCVAACVFATSADASNHCLFSNSDTTPIDPNFGFPNGTPLRGQVLTGYPDLSGSYSTQNVGLYNPPTGQQFLITISADITETDRQDLGSWEGVIVTYSADFQVDAVYAPYQPDPSNLYAFWNLHGPIEFKVVWEFIPTGVAPGWQGQIYRPNSTVLPGEYCLGHYGLNDQSCSSSFVWQTVTGPNLCHNSSIQETEVRAISPASLELMLNVGNNFESALQPLYRRGLPVGEDRFNVGGGAIDIQLGSAEALVLPDGAPEIREANVTLFRQLGAIEPQGGGETSAQFIDRIQRQSRRSSAETHLLAFEDAGLAEFKNLDVLVGTNMAPGTPPQLAPVYYSAIVTGGRTLELDLDTVEPDDTVETVFLVGAATNIQPGVGTPASIGIDLQPADGLTTKRELANNLAEAAPNRFAPLESGTDGVTDFLDSLESGTPTDTQLEAVNRAYWAELAVRDAWQYADPLLGTALSAMGALINDAMAELFGKAKGDVTTRADARLQRQVRDKNQLSNLESDGWPALGGADHGQLVEQLKDAASPPLGPTMKKLLDGIKHLVKAGFIKLGEILAAAGKDGPPAGIFLSGAETAVNAMLDEVFKGGTTSLKTFRPFIISNAINSQKAHLLDSEADYSASALLAGPPPAAESGSGALRYSLDRMQDWSNPANETAYRAARSNTISIINSMNGEATATLQNVAWLEFAVFGADAVASSLDVVANIAPQAAFVEKAANIAKLLGNAALFALPIATGYELVLDAENAAYAAFGMSPPNPLSTGKGSKAQTEVAATGSLVNSLSPAVAPTDTALGELNTALLANDIVASLGVLTGVGTGLGDTAKIFRRESEVFFGQASSGTYPNTSVSGQLSVLLGLESEIDGMLSDVTSRARRLLMEALARRFAGPSDPWYLARRDALRSDIARLRSRLVTFRDDASNGLDEFVFDSQTASYPPVVVLASIQAVSDSTGLNGLSSNGEQFKVTATLSNASSESLANLGVDLSSPAPWVQVLSDSTQTVSSLDANDGDPSAGADRDTVEWTIQFNGDFAAGDMMPLFFTILENGSEPTSFLAVEHFYLIGPDRDAADADFDGLSLFYEVAHGLDPGADDALLDKDGDGLSNIEEQQLETAASLGDTDDDVLSDGEEVNPGADGLRTDPLLTDTDGDGVEDGADAAPLDPLVSSNVEPLAGAQALLEEPIVALSQNDIVLTASDIYTASDYAWEIVVSNAGAGELHWYAESMVPGLLTLTPESGKVQRGPGTLRITSALNRYQKTVALADAIRVVDVSGSVSDEQWISIKVGGGDTQQYTVTVDIEGNGSVSSGDALIDCPDDCSETYVMGTILELTPAPAPDWKFLGWDGSPECGTRVAVAGNINCLARFKSNQLIFENGFEE